MAMGWGKGSMHAWLGGRVVGPLTRGAILDPYLVANMVLD